MFFETGGEYLFMYAKLQPFLDEIHKQEPTMLAQVEKLIKRMPDSEKRLDHIRQVLESM